MNKPRKIELLAPAKNAEIGIEAIRHGADAVYIGAPKFSARAAAGNSIDDIRKLADEAHRFNAKVYIAFNTLLRDNELSEAERSIRELYRAGADALIVQDMGITRLDIPPIALHASTQTDNRSVEKVKFLQDAGFSQVVLARELSLNQIREIASQTDVPLEVFIHGALCVSYSGQCYLSHAMCGRSANRGECAQYCRLPYTLTDGNGRIIAKDKHLLSLKDLNQSDRLEALLDAGASSLKIEGRLKDVAYVKNCTAYYRQALDRIFARRPTEYRAASSGSVSFRFTPDLSKSFNRGFTHYFLDGRSADPIASPDTPKSLGEYIGTLKSRDRNSLVVAGSKPLHNGDGLCFFHPDGQFEGFRVNRAEGNRIYPAKMPDIPVHTSLYRNFDQEFDKLLARPTADRRIRITLRLYETAGGYALTATDEDGNHATVRIDHPIEESRSPQIQHQRTQLAKLGASVFAVNETDIQIDLRGERFIPSSALAELRRKVTDALLRARNIAYRPDTRRPEKPVPFFRDTLDYTGNVANRNAVEFYRTHGVKGIAPAFELKMPDEDVPLMYSRHCIRFMLGYCLRTPQGKDLKEPLTLHYNGRDLPLRFDCKECMMLVHAERKK